MYNFNGLAHSQFGRMKKEVGVQVREENKDSLYKRKSPRKETNIEHIWTR